MSRRESVISEVGEPPAQPAERAPVAESRWDRLSAWAHRIAPFLVVGLFAVAVWLLYHQLEHYRFADIRRSVAALPRAQIVAALLLTIVSYTVLTGYDALALDYIERTLPYRRV